MIKFWSVPFTLKRILKFFGIAFAILFLTISIVSWIIVKKKNDWLLSQIQSYMDESQSGHLQIEALNFKLFKNFPDVTLELAGVTYYEHPDSLRSVEEKPILQAEYLFIAIELVPLMNDELKISDVSVSTAQLNITEDAEGLLNLNRALAKPRKAKMVPSIKKVVPKTQSSSKPSQQKKIKPVPQKAPAIQINLNSISLSNLSVTWSPYKYSRPTRIQVQKAEAEFFSNENVMEASLSSTSVIQTLYLKNKSLPTGNLVFDIDLLFDKKEQNLSIQKGTVRYDEFVTTLEGTYAHRKNGLLNLEVDASSNDLELLSIILKPELLKKNPDLLKQGDVYMKGKVFGELKNYLPQLDVEFGLRDLDLRLPREMGTFKNIGFDGRFTSGYSPDFSGALLEIRKLRGQLPGGFLRGDFSIHNFVDPYIKYDLEAKVKLDGYDEVFNLHSIKQLMGSVSLKANFDGPVKYFKQHTMDNSRSSSITLHDLSFILVKTNESVSGLSGKIENINNTSSIQQLMFTYGQNDVQIDATLENMMHYILLRDTALVTSGKVQSRQLYTKDFLFDTMRVALLQDRISNLSFDFQSTVTTHDTLAMPHIAFAVQNLSADFDKLPNLTLVNTKGAFSMPDSILQLDVHAFHATLPVGKVDVSGDLTVSPNRLWAFNARLNTINFPWTYIKELSAEIQSGKEPTAKNIPAKDMDLITSDLDVSAALITYPFDLNKVDVRDSRISIQLSDSKTVSVNTLNIALENLRFKHPPNSGELTGLKTTKGTMSFQQLKVPGLNSLDIDLNVTGTNDSLDIDFSSASQVAAREEGKLFMDISKKERMYRLQYFVQGVSLEYFMEKFYKKDFMKGEIGYALDLTTAGSSWTALKKNLSGEITVTGDSLYLSGVDIDKVLRKFERSQNFNLTDVGAVLIAGPVGLAVTKGSDFVSLATINLNPKDQTYIPKLHTRWKLENRQLITEDVAFVTKQNRLAFNGRIDFARDSIPGLTVAVIDANGCSLMDQKLYGKTTELKTGKLNITKTLFGSVINFVNVIVGKDCEPVYTGIVEAPK